MLPALVLPPTVLACCVCRVQFFLTLGTIVFGAYVATKFFGMDVPGFSSGRSSDEQRPSECQGLAEGVVPRVGGGHACGWQHARDSKCCFACTKRLNRHQLAGAALC